MQLFAVQLHGLRSVATGPSHRLHIHEVEPGVSALQLLNGLPGLGSGVAAANHLLDLPVRTSKKRGETSKPR
ncbi:hypothetical protein A8B98_16145 [Hymenobacter sp. UV11]|nr:hypothetical protein A8B98_16145 [Hymenobacter sp. UV11]